MLTGHGQCFHFSMSGLYIEWVRFPALPGFLRSSVSGTGSTQPREYN
jgi:hypothetical protein